MFSGRQFVPPPELTLPPVCSIVVAVYSYEVWSYKVRFIITSNNWMELVGKLASDADKTWLRNNSVYDLCEEPLY